MLLLATTFCRIMKFQCLKIIFIHTIQLKVTRASNSKTKSYTIAQIQTNLPRRIVKPQDIKS